MTQGTALVIGASGQVGRACMRSLAAAGFRVVGTYSSKPEPGLVHLDLGSRREIDETVEATKPALCIVSGALTHVDRCESEPDLARRLNVEGPGAVARACARIGARVVHLSTEYVFDGRSGPYGEDAAVHPINVYGQSKLDGERAVLDAADDALIVRTTMVFSGDPRGTNFVSQVVRALRSETPMRIPVDQISTPTYAPDLARALELLVRRGAKGVYNVAGPERLDRMQFAQAIASAFHLDPAPLRAVETRELGQTAHRPLSAGLRIDRLESTVGAVMRPLRECLAEMAAE